MVIFSFFKSVLVYNVNLRNKNPIEVSCVLKKILMFNRIKSIMAKTDIPSGQTKLIEGKGIILAE